MAALMAAQAVGSETAEFGYQRPGVNTLVSVAPDGTPGDGRSMEARVSADGRYVVFRSSAKNLVDGAVHNQDDIFRRDLHTGEIELVSVAADGGAANSWSLEPAVSGDGQVVAFTSFASNLDPADHGQGQFTTAQVYVRDMRSGETIRLSTAPDPSPGVGSVLGSFAPSVSEDGRRVAFHESRIIGPGVFSVPIQTDIYVYDRATATRERVSVAHDGGETDGSSANASLNHDGRYVAFHSDATNLLPDDLLHGGSPRHSIPGAKDASGANDDNDDRQHIYLRDLNTGESELVSVSSDGAPGNHDSSFPSISSDGRYLAFSSTAYNLVPEDTNAAPEFDPPQAPDRFLGGRDVFVRDRAAGTTERVSITSAGEELKVLGGFPSISADGRHVAFGALLPGSFTDGIFVHDRVAGATELVTVTPDGSPSTAGVWQPWLSADGASVVFTATKPGDLFEGDAGQNFGVVRRRRGSGIGVHALNVTEEGDRLLVGGLAGFSGVTVAEASAPPSPGGVPEGPVLRRAGLVFRPEQGDLLAGLELDRLPGAHPDQDLIEEVPKTVLFDPYTASVSRAIGGNYGLGFDLDGVRYELRAQRVGSLAEDDEVAPGFSLHVCEITCELVTALTGGYGTAGHELWISLPLDVLGLTSGTNLTRLVAFVEQEVPSGTLVPGVQLALGDVELPEVSVRIGALPEGLSPDASSLDTTATLSRGAFTAELPTPANGDMRLWAFACIGGECGGASTPVTLEAAPIERIDTNLELSVEDQGQDMTLKARLTELESSDAIVGRIIDFYSDGELIGSDQTDAEGIATAPVPPGHRGANRTYEAIFEGDDFYAPSSDRRPGRGGGQGDAGGSTGQLDHSYPGAGLLL